ncbi:MAG TPA: hypothetical protein VJV23_03955 [Candidatus Polarisedimenticolia bacterium]|nr:hypothetical protein [Candidatus Polarisedimenticolia bacterium]
MKRALVVAFCILASRPALAQVSVQVVDYPVRVLSYSPVFITGAIENHGAEAVLLPVARFHENGYTIETGPTRENLKEVKPFRFDGGGTPLIWLKPGESRLFQMEIGQFLPVSGSIVIRVGLRSTGRCYYFPKGDEAFPLKLLNGSGDRGDPAYECWAGNAMSDPVTIDFIEPDSAVDREAMDYLRSSESGVAPLLNSNWDVPLQKAASELWDRFTTSHYTYAGMFRSCLNSAECLQKLLDIQPSHPLTPYTLFQKALTSINSGHGAEVSVQGLEIPSALKDFLAQERASYEKRQKRTPPARSTGSN